jgi:hypothetical protein
MPSTVIHSFVHDHDSRKLTITFVSGLKYEYKNVPPEVYHMLKAAGSKGRYFNHYIKGKFKYKRLKT